MSRMRAGSGYRPLQGDIFSALRRYADRFAFFDHAGLHTRRLSGLDPDSGIFKHQTA